MSGQFRPCITCILQRRNLTNATKYHNSLETFLQYAKHQGLPVHTTYYVGTIYEYVVLDSLTKNARMSLEHSGGTGDNGVDLRGTMSTYKFQESVPVVVQCKYEQKKPGAGLFRELEGTLVNANPNTLAVLAAPLPATPAGKRVLASSEKAIAFCQILGYEDGGIMSQMIWNNTADKLLRGLRVTQIYEERKAGGKPITVQSVSLVDT
ncbi:hypothetical protein V1509DRAFT_614296 [Lipomyces kononenkoae]